MSIRIFMLSAGFIMSVAAIVISISVLVGG